MADVNMYEYVMERLQDSRERHQLPTVAKGSGVSKRTVEKIARREIQDPGFSHIQKLYEYYRAQPAH